MKSESHRCLLQDKTSSNELETRILPRGIRGDTFENDVNVAVESYLVGRMGASTFKIINYYLHDITGLDLSNVSSKPSVLEEGLRELFGVGTPTVVRACIFAAFRGAGLIPDREYKGLEDALTELRQEILGGSVPAKVNDAHQ